MASAASLSEPRVLAHAKRRVFAADDPEGYAVVDTQFGTDEWLSGRPIPASVQDTLAPFNHVRVGSGYPDLVGVCALDDELHAVDRLGDDLPLIAIEAKGYTDAGTVGVERGVVQAHDRLHGANVAYVAAPTRAVTASSRALARELNVGMLGVDSEGTVTPLEQPRVVGTHAAEEATAIRFQATASGVTTASFGLNHPKNYLAYPLAQYHPEETTAVLADRVVAATDDAKRGALCLGLIEERAGRVVLTGLGREVVRFALDRHGSVDAALDCFAGWRRSRKRFCTLDPGWGQVARRVVWAHPAARLLITELQTMYDDGIEAPSLVDVVTWLHVTHPAFAIELFVRGTDGARQRVLDAAGELQPAALRDGNVYHAPTVFQLKAILYHVGMLEARGSEPHRLDPPSDSWRLRQPV